MDEREKQIQELCGKVKNANPNFFDNPNGGYENTCPFCYAMAYGSSQSPEVDMDEIKHDTDCAYLIAKDLSTNF